jgi:hypothetical protein
MKAMQYQGQKDDFQQLVDEILSKRLSPEDAYEIAALLESMGWNDDRAAYAFAVQDVFELAQQIEAAIQDRVSYQPVANAKPHSTRKMAMEMIRSFLRGLIFALPMALSVISMLTLKFSLWSYEYLSVEQATSIAIGTILSFLAVGGFTQAIARRGFFYIIQDYYVLARKTTFYFIRWGFVVCLAFSLLLLGLNLIFNLFPYRMLLYVTLYFFFLYSIWLSVTVMYILRKELLFSGLIILGIFIVYLLFRIGHLDIIFAQIIALVIIALSGLALVLFIFKRMEQKAERGIAIRLPRISITLYSIAPYFLYGFLYFFFLFVDRTNAWSANEDYMPYVIWFRGAYELGLDFALLILIIPMGVSEVIVTKLMLDVEATQKQFLGNEIEKMNRKYVKFYYRMLGVIGVVSVISAFLVYLLMKWYNSVAISLNGENLLGNPITIFVFGWATLAYVILALFLMNAVILFSLSQPQKVNRSITPGLLLNILIGFLLSRWIHYYDAVFGLFVGCLVMAVLSTIQVKSVLSNLDYYLYAAV